MNKTIIVLSFLLLISNILIAEPLSSNKVNVVNLKSQFKSPQSDQRTTLLIQYRNRMESLRTAKTQEEKSKILGEIEIIKKQLNNLK